MFAYGMTTGPVALVYAAETTIDAGIGIVFLMLYASIFVLTLVCPMLMDKQSSFGPVKSFVSFAAISILGALFYSTHLVETKGKTPKEKMEMYFNS